MHHMTAQQELQRHESESPTRLCLFPELLSGKRSTLSARELRSFVVVLCPRSWNFVHLWSGISHGPPVVVRNLDVPAIRNANQIDSRESVFASFTAPTRFAERGSVREPSSNSRESGESRESANQCAQIGPSKI